MKAIVFLSILLLQAVCQGMPSSEIFFPGLYESLIGNVTSVDDSNMNNAKSRNRNVSKSPDLTVRSAFQDQVKELLSDVMPPCAINSNFGVVCENDPEYDQTISKMFDDALMKAFGEDSISMSPLLESLIYNEVPFDAEPELSVRIGESAIKESVCLSSKKTIYPKRGLTRGNKWAYILNQHNFRQNVIVEECLNSYDENSPKKCDNLAYTHYPHDNYCQQNFIYKSLFTIENGTKITKKLFLMPAACVCYVVKEIDTRSGVPLPRNNGDNIGESLVMDNSEPEPKKMSSQIVEDPSVSRKVDIQTALNFVIS